jgi:hypothetical protein
MPLAERTQSEKECREFLSEPRQRKSNEPLLA